MDLTHEQTDRYLCKIFTGKELVYVNDGSKDVCIEFRQPDNTIILRASLIYDSVYDKAISEGLLSTKDIEKLIIKRNLFTADDQKALDSLRSKLEGQEVLLAKTIVVKAHQDRLKGIIRDLNSQIRKIEMKKTSMLILSAESKAQEEKSLFICSACTYNFDTKELYWPSFDYLLKETNIIFKDKVLYKFLTFYTGIDTAIIRHLARSNLWRIRYVTSQKTAESLFGIPTTEYTNDMLNLTYWSNFYQNIYEMMAEDRPSDLVIEDDEALDAYMKSYYDDRSKEDAARKSKHRTGGKLSAFDKEEVIVTQSNELYEDIKYDKPREAQKIKERPDIKKRTRRR